MPVWCRSSNLMLHDTAWGRWRLAGLPIVCKVQAGMQAGGPMACQVKAGRLLAGGHAVEDWDRVSQTIGI